MSILNTNSRYIPRVTHDGTTIRIISSRKKLNLKTFTIHTAGKGDTFSILAKKYLGDEYLYWMVADINPQVKFPDSITVGTQIRIPFV
ncbi:LysM domain [uncultured Caudovirales phage]|uniref:LysM domain n=1 Tax=uncultured Caudovirales phage TaxID=2100421 RepID=A0A6J7WZG0_9CAUD|nr:LysM domain [uncultured Caudovirales phage]